ncbi:MAG: hypothetical protein WAM14_22410 [Candidatus Nitrosopolaris sp.]
MFGLFPPSWFKSSDTFVECIAKIIIVAFSYSLIVANQTVHSMLKVFMPIYSFVVHSSYRSSKSARSMKQTPRVSKSKLFLIISALTTAVFLPVAILPHINQPFLVYRSSIHVASIIISVFLIIVSILTYRRTGSIKILYTSVAFLSLLVVECIFLLQIMPDTSRIMLPMPVRMLPYTFLLIMLALFGLGVLRVEK